MQTHGRDVYSDWDPFTLIKDNKHFVNIGLQRWNLENEA